MIYLIIDAVWDLMSFQVVRSAMEKNAGVGKGLETEGSVGIVNCVSFLVEAVQVQNQIIFFHQLSQSSSPLFPWKVAENT